MHLGSFSKILAPGMRLGWAVASPEILEKLTLLKLAADTQSSTLNMAATSAYLSDYDIDAHIARARPVYRHKRDLMLADHRGRTFPDDIGYTEPDGGLFTWLTFPAGFDAAQFMRITCCRRPRSRTCRARPSSRSPQQPHHARLSYSGVPDERLVRGIAEMASLLHWFEPIAPGDLTVTRDRLRRPVRRLRRGRGVASGEPRFHRKPFSADKVVGGEAS